MSVVRNARVSSAAVALAYAVIIWADGRADRIAPLVMLLATAVMFALHLYLRGRPQGALFALLVAAALNRYTAELAGASIKPEHVVAPLVALALLPDVRRLVRRLDTADRLMLAWLGWSVVGGLLNAPDPGNSTRLWVMLLLVAFCYFAVVTVTTDATALLGLTRDWVVVGVAAGAFGVLTHLAFMAGVDLGIRVNPVTRDPTVLSTFYEANLFGSAMMMLGLYGIALLVLGTSQPRLAWIAALVGVLAVQVSLTRTAWVAFAAGLLLILAGRFWFTLRGRARPTRLPPMHARAFSVLLACALLGTALLWVPESGRSEQSSVANQSGPTRTPTATPTLPALVVGTARPDAVATPLPGNPDIGGRVTSIADMSDASIRIRIEFARRAINDWRAHPIVGLGVGSFGQRYITTSMDRAWLSNVVVRLLHDGGLIGLALFSAAMALHLRRVVQLLVRPEGSEVERVAIALSVSIAAMFVAFQATEGLQIAWYWFALGLFAAAVRPQPPQLARR